eukprot:6321426-Karenia_brevis.AAC.1
MVCGDTDHVCITATMVSTRAVFGIIMVGMSCGYGHVPGWTTATKYCSVADKVYHHWHHGGWGISTACITGTIVSTRAFGG